MNLKALYATKRLGYFSGSLEKISGKIDFMEKMGSKGAKWMIGIGAAAVMLPKLRKKKAEVAG